MNEFILPADMKSIVQTHTVCTMQVDKNKQKNRMLQTLNWTICSGVGGRTTKLKTHS